MPVDSVSYSKVMASSFGNRPYSLPYHPKRNFDVTKLSKLISYAGSVLKHVYSVKPSLCYGKLIIKNGSKCLPYKLRGNFDVNTLSEIKSKVGSPFWTRLILWAIPILWPPHFLELAKVSSISVKRPFWLILHYHKLEFRWGFLFESCRFSEQFQSYMQFIPENGL